MATGHLLLLLAILPFFLTKVSSDLKPEDNSHNTIQGGLMRGPTRRLMQEIDCGGLCKQRCSLHSRPNVCRRACGTCCLRCKCVPPGTSGNQEACGTCYTGMTTHGNRTKCP
ncbi:gibberellin-regulated protein 11-like [Diospyros lotus]|uniref:gibberellin-regulated protein 11-like n=1 Tax=Diospyros lotus TaxID=55363 RepID=UPI00225318E4|nr:gibberellin-regulated protein 11-like [Diospyros lotus]